MLIRCLSLCAFAGGKGYRKPVRTAATSSGADDKKLSLALKKLGKCHCVHILYVQPVAERL